MKTVTVSGQVLDFTTGDPVEGATVDVTTAWDIVGNFPHPECPVQASLTTDAEGRFGPKAVLLGSNLNPSFAIFMVHGGDRAQTASDARTCMEATCNLGHTIAVPSQTLASTWRSTLAAGGMADAATRGLIAYKYKNNDGTNAVGVVPSVGEGAGRPLASGGEVRFVTSDRSTLSPATDTDTDASGVALIGTDPPADKAVDIGGSRATQTWSPLGCIIEPGWIFVEDKLGSP
jgi:hypothetical protein